ncbi:MAG: hypothetical protein ACK6AD_02395 [Cyanobacteriota bacterium]
MTQRNTAQRIEWAQQLRRMMPPSPTSDGGDWYKPVVATACIAATVAMLNVWADMRIIKGDLVEIKTAGITNAGDIADLQRRIVRLEVQMQAHREVMRMTGVSR